jgi:hypothetical protein
MAEDGVYQEFVLPYYRKTLQELALERRAREQAEKRAEDERKRAERLASMLREAGITFDEG